MKKGLLIAILATAMLSACSKSKKKNTPAAAAPSTEQSAQPQGNNGGSTEPSIEAQKVSLPSNWRVRQLSFSLDTLNSGEAYLTVGAKVSEYLHYDHAGYQLSSNVDIIRGQVSLKDIKAGEKTDLALFTGKDSDLSIQVQCSSDCKLNQDQMINVSVYDNANNTVIYNLEIEDFKESRVVSRNGKNIQVKPQYIYATATYKKSNLNPEIQQTSMIAESDVRIAASTVDKTDDVQILNNYPEGVNHESTVTIQYDFENGTTATSDKSYPDYEINFSINEEEKK